ncbi:methyltransferase domain-containing protein [Geodermatophilus marinus]|uniref:methyltransferase domain-containing protein n=1 Tax=Geodermatophilus sp. LHW52908 TaxID=2303986 RepID=UPI0018F70936|nr:methyltransferase domain-containing protein [Geodermatophilus sp. LHW52908]
MSSTDTFQLSLQTAETYEAAFVPSLFAHLAPHLVDAAGVTAGDRVLDVACGTGIVARTAAERAGPAGHVVGLDLNEAMLTVARRIRPDLDWRQGDAASLPFPDGSFDVALCQSGLMFVPDVAASVGEMARVVRPGGRVAAQVWSSLDRQTAIHPLADAVARFAGRDAVDLIGTYFRLGDREEFTGQFTRAGLRVSDVRTLPVTVRAPSVDDYITTEVESTPLVDRISEDVYRRIREEARAGLARYRDATGALVLPLEAYLVAAARG